MKYFLLSFAFLLGLGIFSTGASAEEPDFDYDEFISQVKVFDGDNNQIHYTKEELEQLIWFEPENLITPFSKYTSFNYGPMTFSYNFYVGDGLYGRAFLNPINTAVTVKGTASPFKINVMNDTGSGPGTLATSIEMPGGWSGTVHYSGWGSLPRNKSYRFQFVNQGAKFTIDNVKTDYNWQG